MNDGIRNTEYGIQNAPSDSCAIRDPQSAIRILFRVDASPTIGLGHFNRCLTLACWLRDPGAEIHFAMSEPTVAVRETLARERLVLHPFHGTADGFDPDRDLQAMQELLSQTGVMDLLVVDHYQIGSAWETALRPLFRRILIFDDLADRTHDCDGLCDPNFVDGLESRYDGLLPVQCHPFLGPEFLLLRDEFSHEVRNADVRNGVKRILVSYGGSDPTGETGKAIAALRDLPDVRVDLVIGPADPRGDEWETAGRDAGFSIHRPTRQMARLCREADLALGAGGTALWERAALGLPAIVTITAPNQRDSCLAAANREAIVLAGTAQDADRDGLRTHVQDFLRNPESLRRFSRAAFGLIPSPRSGPDHPLVEWIMRV